MKKGLMSFVLLTSVLSILLLSGIFAAAPTKGTCAIVPRASCISANGNYILMGVSDATNGHGEFPDTGLYSYVLCCTFGTGATGNTNCTAGVNSPIMKLSAATNAHAEVPLGTNYNTKICYEDLNCISSSDNCGMGTAAAYSLGVASLVSSTNSHIGNITDYSTKICCSSALYAGCSITNATWNMQNAVAGQKVYLRVNGTSSCNGKSIMFQIFRNDGNLASTILPVNVSFNGAYAIGVWNATWQKGYPSDYFNVSLVKNSLVSLKSDSPNLIVTQQSSDFCATRSSCGDYNNQLDCQSDSCKVAATSGIVDCTNSSYICGCAWDKTSCKFGWSMITQSKCGTPLTGCGYGCTLCNDSTGKTYCGVGSTCSSPNKIATNNNGTCDFGVDGCASSDCKDGEQDTCSSGNYCSFGECSNVIAPPVSVGSCNIVEKIDKTCDVEPTGYKIISWSGTWTDGSGNQITDSANCNGDNECTGCVAGGQSTVPCPAQVQLPFFDYLELIASVVVIALIYISLVFRKKFKKKK